MKRAALISKYRHQWPTIDGDFRGASENRLSEDAKAPRHGEWFVEDALKWARQRGKCNEAVDQTRASMSTPFTGLTHKIKG